MNRMKILVKSNNKDFIEKITVSLNELLKSQLDGTMICVDDTSIPYVTMSSDNFFIVGDLASIEYEQQSEYYIKLFESLAHYKSTNVFLNASYELVVCVKQTYFNTVLKFFKNNKLKPIVFIDDYKEAKEEEEEEELNG